jgi:hypothetical protein
MVGAAFDDGVVDMALFFKIVAKAVSNFFLLINANSEWSVTNFDLRLDLYQVHVPLVL